MPKGLVLFTQLAKERRVNWFWHFQVSDFHESSLALWPPRGSRAESLWRWGERRFPGTKFLMGELNHENLNGAVILWKFNINDILSHTLVSAYGFSLSRILPYFLLSLRASANKRDINGEICPSLLATE